MSDGTKKNDPCPECGSAGDWGGASWCPQCGYYPAVKRAVANVTQEEEETVYEHWWEVVPAWMWTMAAGIGALFVLSLAVRVLFAESMIRTLWTVAQMGLGMIALFAVHIMAYFYGVGRSDRLGPLDMFLQPLATWQPVFKDLPGSSHLVSSMGCSVAAIALGFFVVDGIDYVAIMQEDAEARKLAQVEQAAKDAAEGKKKTSMMGMMLQGATTVAQAKQAMSPNDVGPPPESLEEALGSFAGAAPLTGDGTLDALVNGGGGEGTGGLDGALVGFTAEGGIDVNSYIDQQKAIASGGGKESDSGTGLAMSGSANPIAAGNSSTGVDSPSASETGSDADDETGIRRPNKRGSPQSTDRNVHLPSADRETKLANPESSRVRSEAAAVSDPTKLLREEVECLVIGYTTNASGDLRSLLLAAAPDRRQLRFVAKVPVDQVDAHVLATLTSRFGDLPARRPFVRCPYGGRWIQPELFCAATFDGWTSDDRLNNPQITRMLDMSTR